MGLIDDCPHDGGIGGATAESKFQRQPYLLDYGVDQYLGISANCRRGKQDWDGRSSWARADVTDVH
jgi:hypothetical protein